MSLSHLVTEQQYNICWIHLYWYLMLRSIRPTYLEPVANTFLTKSLHAQTFLWKTCLRHIHNRFEAGSQQARLMASGDKTFKSCLVLTE